MLFLFLTSPTARFQLYHTFFYSHSYIFIFWTRHCLFLTQRSKRQTTSVSGVLSDSGVNPSSLAMFHLTVFIALLLSCCLSLASAIPFERRTAGVITQCRVDFCTFATCSTFLPAIWEADFFFLYPASFFRMTVHTNICTTYSSCRHNHCALIPVFLRKDVVTTLKNANAKGTFFFSSWSVKCLFNARFIV